MLAGLFSTFALSGSRCVDGKGNSTSSALSAHGFDQYRGSARAIAE
jgi:hypothetical protein